MPQHMRRHIRRQVAQLGDARPQFREAEHAAVAAGRREYQLARANRAAGCAARCRRRATAAGTAARSWCRRARSAPGKIDLRPSQRQRLAAAPTRQRKETRGRYRAGQIPFASPWRSAAPSAAYSSSLSRRSRRPSAKRMTPCTGLSGRNPLAHGVSEDCAEQPHRAGRRAPATAHPRQSPPLRLDTRRGLAFGDGMHEPLDIGSRHCGHRQAAEQRFEMTFDAAAIDRQRAGLFRGPRRVNSRPARRRRGTHHRVRPPS